MNICLDAFKNIYIESQNNHLNIAPCCVSEPIKVSKIDFYNSNFKKIRDQWTNNQYPPECGYCKNAEDNDLGSRRQGSNNWYADNGIRDSTVELIRIDYWVGDTCNLACLICGPHNSSKWKQEKSIPIKEVAANINKSWNNLDLNNLKFIHFNGGEPLLSKEHILFLAEIPDPAQVHLNYNTNGTILPSDNLIKLWEKFKLVQIDFSIDDIEERFEIQRYPASWNNVVSNLKWFYNYSPVNCMFSINTTISILNQSNINNIKSWVQDNFPYNRLQDPVEHRFQFAVGLFDIHNSDSQEIVKFLDELDLKRHTNWRKMLPDVAKIVDSV
jgi:sulfatase maturation enzyme AslB (radical SAM superfamily)